MIKIMLKKALFNWRMLVVVCASAALFYLELLVGKNILYVDYCEMPNLTMLIEVMALSYYVVFAGLFPGVPYGFSLLEERNSGYVRYILQRMRPGRYILQRIFFVGLSGVVSTVLPYILLLITIVGITDSATVDNMQSSVVNNLIWANFSTVWGGGLVMLMKGVLLGLFGILWSELTLLISLHVRNRYVAFVLPFVFFQLCWILIPVNNVNPVFLIRADLERSCPVSLPYVILISYILVVIAAICMSFRRKIRNETF